MFFERIKQILLCFMIWLYSLLCIKKVKINNKIKINEKKYKDL